MKTLIVEDNPTFRKAFKSVLCDLYTSMEVVEAADGQEALREIDTMPPDLVFMDVRLPGETGFALTRTIKARHPEIVILIITDYNLPEYREAALESGADGFVSKESLTPPTISEWVESVFSDKKPG